MNTGPMKRWLPKLDAKSGPLESGDFGENGKFFPEGWRFNLDGKSGRTATGDFGKNGKI